MTDACRSQHPERFLVLGLLVLWSLVLGEFPLALRQGSPLNLLSVGIPTILLALWARPGVPPKGGLFKQIVQFVVTPVLKQHFGQVRQFRDSCDARPQLVVFRVRILIRVTQSVFCEHTLDGLAIVVWQDDRVCCSSRSDARAVR